MEISFISDDSHVLVKLRARHSLDVFMEHLHVDRCTLVLELETALRQSEGNAAKPSRPQGIHVRPYSFQQYVCWLGFLWCCVWFLRMKSSALYAALVLGVSLRTIGTKNPYVLLYTSDVPNERLVSLQQCSAQ